MKIIKYVALLLLLPSLAWCATLQGAKISGGGFNIGAVTPPVSGCPNASLLACESFDGASQCTAGYTSNCDRAWLVGAGTPNYAGTALDGGIYGLALNGKTNAANCYVYTTYTPTDGQSQDHYFQLKLTDFGTSTAGSIFFLLKNAATTTMAYLQFKVTGGAVHISAMASGGTESSNSVGTLSVNTTYHFWVNYLKGTGSNAKITAAFSTDGVRPTSGDNYVESTNGTATTNSARITLYGPYTTSSQCFDALYDKVRIDDALIGDNPS